MAPYQNVSGRTARPQESPYGRRCETAQVRSESRTPRHRRGQDVAPDPTKRPWRFRCRRQPRTLGRLSLHPGRVKDGWPPSPSTGGRRRDLCVAGLLCRAPGSARRRVSRSRVRRRLPIGSPPRVGRPGSRLRGDNIVARRRTIRFTLAEDDFQLLLMLARTERKTIEDLFRESVPEVLAKYSILVRRADGLPDPALARRRRPR